jgi:hypothetical protein
MTQQLSSRHSASDAWSQNVQKVTGWVADYNRLLLKLVSEPDREWRQLTGVAS